MLPVFTLPLALIGLAALPTLAAIYWLRNRFRKQPVSSLMLWAEHREVREGGTRKHRLQTPLVFYLELLALLLLAVAAAGPHVQTSPGTRPLIVVLDDSYSMSAGGPDSPRDQAVAALEKEVRDHSYALVRFVLAGDGPQILGDPAHSARELTNVLREWRCRAPRCRMEDTLALASELAGDRALILVVTDHAPENPPGKGRLQWRAFGTARPNIAFINAARNARDGAERCLLEIGNFSSIDQTTALRITTGEPAQELQESVLTLQRGETRRIILELREGTSVLIARLGTDDLEIDSRVLLYPTTLKPIRVQVQIQNKVLWELVEKAIRATRGAEISAVMPHLFVTDREGLRPEGAACWRALFVVEKEAEAYTGPFVMDRSHPLTQGLELQGVVWGAGKTEQLSGVPVIMAGNLPLVTDAGGLTERHELRIRLRPDLSTLPESPNWPILFWNLVQWRASAEPGLSRTNVRLGDDTTLTLPTPRESLVVVTPSGKTRTMAVHGRRVVVRAEDVGVYHLRSEDDRHEFAVNTLNADESNLQTCASGRWGDWLDETTLRLEYQNMAWALLLIVLGVLTLHAFLIARSGGRERA